MLDPHQIDAYLDRIGFVGDRTPNGEILRQLHLAHMYRVPFENLDIPLGTPIDLSLEALFDKIVYRRRGGFCYELNYLFSRLLAALGFEVRMLSAQVYQNGAYGRHFDHMTLSVALDGQSVIADVGFGDSFREPLPLATETREPLGVGYRIQQDGDAWVMQQRKPGETWQHQYLFTLQGHDIEAYHEMCLYQQTNPESSFSHKSVCSIATPDGRSTISNGRFIRSTADGRHVEPIETESAYRDLLQRHFQVALPEDASLARLLYRPDQS
ncbi:Arylamine N-acetyltransferase [Sulfidibacter corallicola]|uniref:Arylamine N-acetyltransferase n=1 Tax=Sulfidibacter corallicola TaxID=2818388 RepID=A0A8A4TMC8_SULCO|nr:arylamine N-acetyltransferase [Sulfidibacter corallicola]QTD50617.1 arylamine N-acetyltransferase [Sulfidibacter corallicola]